jgi:hypothetical protein
VETFPSAFAGATMKGSGALRQRALSSPTARRNSMKMKKVPSMIFAATALEEPPSEAETVKRGMLKRRIIGSSVQWKEREIRLTNDSFCTFNHLGELCENISLLEIETCMLSEQVPLSLAALFSTFSQ